MMGWKKITVEELNREKDLVKYLLEQGVADCYSALDALEVDDLVQLHIHLRHILLAMVRAQASWSRFQQIYPQI